MRVHLTRISENRKTGRIPVSTSESSTCPPTCPHKDAGCYARFGKLGFHWQGVDRGQARNLTGWDRFCSKIAELPDGQLWRHNQAGDLPGIGGRIAVARLRKLIAANKGKRGFTFTHKPMTPKNEAAVREANENGFTINVSADTMTDADRYFNMGLPTAMTLPENYPAKSESPAGNKIVVCPAQINDDKNCKTCALCSIRDRGLIVGFLAHGISKSKVEKVFQKDLPALNRAV